MPFDPAAHLGTLRRIKGWFRADQRHAERWRKEAKSDFAFYANEQWSREDVDYLTAQNRVPITFNRTFSILNSVAGTEINSRQETRFIPRGTEDVKVNEVLTAGSRWMADGCDAEDEQSQAFQDAMICGMGWTEARLDYDDEPEGRYVEEAVDPLEMYWDEKARKKNLADARRLFRVRRVSLAEARKMFPDVPDEFLDADFVYGEGPTDAKSREAKVHRDEADGEEDDEDVTIVQAQWWEREPYWLVADPSGQTIEMDEEEHARAAKRAQDIGIELRSVRLERKRYYQAFIGKVVLDLGEAPCRSHFSFNCITGYRDRNRGTWFGLVRVMRDPQMWANKWLTQTLHILNSTAKGGVIAERDAFDDQRQAEESYARPEGITWAAPGAIAKNKIMPKPGGGFPNGYMQLMEFAISSIRDVPGINLELLGLRDANQPGILEAQRKQAAMTVLATLFDSLRRFRKMVGRIRLYFLQNNFSDGRLIRIVGPEGEQAVPLVKERTTGKYDVIVDEAPTSPNQKEQNWQIIMSILPAFREQIASSPELVLEIAKASPLPSALVDAIGAAINKPNPQAEERADMARAAAFAEIESKQADAMKKRAEAMRASVVPEQEEAPDIALLKIRKQLAAVEKSMADAERSRAEAAKAQMQAAMVPFDLERRRAAQLAMPRVEQAGQS